MIKFKEIKNAKHHPKRMLLGIFLVGSDSNFLRRNGGTVMFQKDIKTDLFSENVSIRDLIFQTAKIITRLKESKS
jgi:hypothetical protein